MCVVYVQCEFCFGEVVVCVLDLFVVYVCGVEVEICDVCVVEVEQMVCEYVC